MSCPVNNEGLGTTKYYFGDDVADLGDYAWYDKNTKPYGTRPCGQKKPNAFGLYDMHGLAWEWCDDGKRTYLDDAESDPVGAGESRVIVAARSAAARGTAVRLTASTVRPRAGTTASAFACSFRVSSLPSLVL